MCPMMSGALKCRKMEEILFKPHEWGIQWGLKKGQVTRTVESLGAKKTIFDRFRGFFFLASSTSLEFPGCTVFVTLFSLGLLRQPPFVPWGWGRDRSSLQLQSGPLDDCPLSKHYLYFGKSDFHFLWGGSSALQTWEGAWNRAQLTGTIIALKEAAVCLWFMSPHFRDPG